MIILNKWPGRFTGFPFLNQPNFDLRWAPVLNEHANNMDVTGPRGMRQSDQPRARAPTTRQREDHFSWYLTLRLSETSSDGHFPSWPLAGSLRHT